MVKPLSLIVVLLLLPWPLYFSERIWWAFIPATAAILITLRLIQKDKWLEIAGLKTPRWHRFFALMLFIAIAAAAHVFLQNLYSLLGLHAEYPPLLDQAGLLFQSLNEEIFFRALLIAFCVQYFCHRGLVSVLLAVFFAMSHFFLYRYSNPIHLALSLNALLTLFFAGLAMNNLYLAFGHIGFSFALHAGWNVIWLPAIVIDMSSGHRLSEPQLFNRVLSSPSLLVVVAGMAIVTMVISRMVSKFR